MPFLSSFWECGKCEEPYKTKEEAFNCCNNRILGGIKVSSNIESKNIFLCPECLRKHINYSEALYCCPRDFDKFWQMRIDHAQLEDYGQQRLF